MNVLVTLKELGCIFLTKVSRSVQMKMSPKMGSKSQKAPIGIKTTRVKLNDCVRLERGHLSWFRYPTHNFGTYLVRGVDVDVFFSLAHFLNEYFRPKK